MKYRVRVIGIGMDGQAKNFGWDFGKLVGVEKFIQQIRNDPVFDTCAITLVEVPAGEGI